MQRGRTNIYSKFERKILSDIRDSKRAQNLSSSETVKSVDIS